MNRIKELRKGKHLTITELSNLVSIPQSTLTNYENGKRTPRSQATWQKLADYFDVSVPYIMGISNLNQNNLPINPFERLGKSNDYDRSYELISKSFEIFSNTLISDSTTNETNSALSFALYGLSVSYDFFLKAYGPTEVQKLSKILELIGNTVSSTTQNKILKNSVPDNEIQLTNDSRKKEILSLLDELSSLDRNFYDGENLRDHKPFYSDGFNDNSD